MQSRPYASAPVVEVKCPCKTSSSHAAICKVNKKVLPGGENLPRADNPLVPVAKPTIKIISRRQQIGTGLMTGRVRGRAYDDAFYLLKSSQFTGHAVRLLLQKG